MTKNDLLTKQHYEAIARAIAAAKQDNTPDMVAMFGGTLEAAADRNEGIGQVEAKLSILFGMADVDFDEEKFVKMCDGGEA